MPRLIQELPSGPLDIIGDVHGEHEALLTLLDRLGCDPHQRAAQRPIVFVGDLTDRGPDSPGVVETVRGLVERGIAQCVVGNHELNLMLGHAKEGNGWAAGDTSDAFQFRAGSETVDVPFDSRVATKAQLADCLEFFSSLPLALVRQDLRVVHACWHEPSIERLPEHGDIAKLGEEWDREVRATHETSGLAERERAEFAEFAQLKRFGVRPDRECVAHAEATVERQMLNPMKVLTSGLEERITFDDIFFAGGKWRFVQRMSWWERIPQDTTVVVGHYWRRRGDETGTADRWRTPKYTDWTGPRNNVFCVDYAAGHRYLERHRGRTSGFKSVLAALRWPEKQLLFDDGLTVPTTVPAG
jgi:hypothetical protein